MSVLVAIKEKDKIVVGVDTRMTLDNTSFVDSYKRRPKAFHLDRDCNVIIGGVGNVALVDMFASLLEDYANDIQIIDRKYIVRYIVPALVSQVDAHGVLMHGGDTQSFMDGTLFLAIDNRAYSIAGNGTVSELVDYTAMGSGEYPALGSLFTTEGLTMKSEDRIKIAIKAAGAIINSVSNSPMIGSTKGKLFRLYE